jgi:hypothetical protein
MLELDFEPPSEHHCECCGGVTVTLTRFVHDDDETVGAYYARFGRNHSERVVQALVSIGPWGEGTGPWDRVAFPLRLWVANDQYQVGVTDTSESPWKDVDIFGRILDREEALRDERLKEVFHITDHMVVEDRPLHDYLNGAV